MSDKKNKELPFESAAQELQKNLGAEHTPLKVKQKPEELGALDLLGSGVAGDSEAELAALRKLIKSSPAKARALCLGFFEQRALLQKRLVRANARLAKAEKAIAQIKTPPLHPASVLRVDELGRVEVICDGRRLLVTAGPDVELASIEPHDEVFLDSDGGTIVARSPVARRTGSVGTVSELIPDGALIRCAGDEETVMVVSPELELGLGDRVVYALDFPYVISKLAKRDQSQFLLESVPQQSFDDIGGLDELIGDVRRDLDLHLKHPEIAKRHGLSLLRGITLVGLPGVGKTMLARAIANYIAKDVAGRSGGAYFMHVKPGALRGIYYGQAEQRIRSLFDAARNADGLVVIFFDEIDTFGSRGVGIGQDIDGRVLGALLSEMDGLEEANDLLCIGATNRLDLCDAALVRTGRLGDRIYEIPRPARDATRQILSRYLAPDSQLAATTAAELVDAAASYLHTQHEGAGRIATITLRNGDQREIRSADVLSGALLASAVQRARHTAAHREVEASRVGNGAASAEQAATLGLRLEDLLSALDDALGAEAKKIAQPQFARQVLQIPNGQEIVRVELARERRIPHHRYVRAA